jgi:hypothetical protein
VRRRLLNLLTLLSLLLCVAVVALWVRSLYVADNWTYFGAVGAASQNDYMVSIYPRRLTLALRRSTFPPEGRTSYVASGARGNEAGWWFNVHPRLADYPDLDRALRREATGLGFAASHHGGTVNTKWSGPAGYVEGITSDWRVSMPYWFPAALFAAGPVARLARRVRRARRASAGKCTGCGYDLRATPDRCPECGMTSPATAGGSE